MCVLNIHWNYTVLIWHRPAIATRLSNLSKHQSLSRFKVDRYRKRWNGGIRDRSNKWKSCDKYVKAVLACLMMVAWLRSQLLTSNKHSVQRQERIVEIHSNKWRASNPRKFRLPKIRILILRCTCYNRPALSPDRILQSLALEPLSFDSSRHWQWTYRHFMQILAHCRHKLLMPRCYKFCGFNLDHVSSLSGSSLSRFLKIISFLLICLLFCQSRSNLAMNMHSLECRFFVFVIGPLQHVLSVRRISFDT